MWKPTVPQTAPFLGKVTLNRVICRADLRQLTDLHASVIGDIATFAPALL
jgi:hypothetical protein